MNPSNNRHQRGASAALALASELLYYDYNVAFPYIDSSSGDDMIAISKKSKKVTRIQVRSLHLELQGCNDNFTRSRPIQLPQSIKSGIGTAEIACIALRIPGIESWKLGLIGVDMIKNIKESEVKPARHNTSTEQISGYRIKVCLNGADRIVVKLGIVDISDCFDRTRSYWSKLLD